MLTTIISADLNTVRCNVMVLCCLGLYTITALQKARLLATIPVSVVQILEEIYSKVYLCNIANFRPKVTGESLKRRIPSQIMISKF